MAYVQSKSNAQFTAPAATVAVTLDAPVGSGNLVVGMVIWQDPTDSLTSVTDNQSNTYTIQRQILNPESDGNSSVAVFYKEGITNGPTTLTANFSPTTLGTILVEEVSGILTAAALDVETGVSQSNPGTTPNAINSGSVTTTVANAHIFGASMQAFGALTGPLYAAGTNYTKRQEAGGNSQIGTLGAIEDRVLASAGSVAATFTWSGAADDFATFVMAFKPSAGGPTQAPRSMAMYRRRRQY